MNNKKFPLAGIVFILFITITLSGCGTNTNIANTNTVNTNEPPAQTEEVVVTKSVADQPVVENQINDTPIAAPSEPLPPESLTQIELILDDSGSMWGQVEGRAKIDVAKESMNKIIDELQIKDKLQVSLRIYGHQNKECTNSVLEIPMGKIDAEQMKNKIKDLKPLGFTPISYSLIESVKDFDKNIPGDKIVILVTDGLESCNADPCAVAKALKAGGIINKMQIVGFGLTTTELSTLKCIVDPFGGQVVGANNATEFMTAMQGIMDTALDKNLDLRGKNSQGEDVYMTVKVMQGDKIVAEGRGTQVLFNLPAGKYDIQADAYSGSADQVVLTGIELQKDQLTKKEIVFIQGNFNVKIVGINNEPLQASHICVYPQGETAKELTCFNFKVSEHSFTLKPGVYDLKVVNSGTSDEAWVKNIEITELGVVTKVVSFAEGTLKVNVVGTDGKPLQARSICIYPQGETVKELTCYNFQVSDHSFILKLGLYDLKVINKGTYEETWVKNIEIKDAGVVNKVVSFAEGKLKVNVVGTDGKPLQARSICIYPQGETAKELSCASYQTAEFSFTLKLGLYDLKVISKINSTEKWSKGIEIKASQTVNQKMEF